MNAAQAVNQEPDGVFPLSGICCGERFAGVETSPPASFSVETLRTWVTPKAEVRCWKSAAEAMAPPMMIPDSGDTRWPANFEPSGIVMVWFSRRPTGVFSLRQSGACFGMEDRVVKMVGEAYEVFFVVLFRPLTVGHVEERGVNREE